MGRLRSLLYYIVAHELTCTHISLLSYLLHCFEECIFNQGDITDFKPNEGGVCSMFSIIVRIAQRIIARDLRVFVGRPGSVDELQKARIIPDGR